MGAVARAAVVLIMFNFASKILGVIRDVVVAREFGATSAMDAYLVAFSIPNVIFALFTGALTTVVIPVYSEYATREGERQAWSLFATVCNVLLLLLTALTALGWLAAPLLVRLLAPGFSAELAASSAALTRIIFPFLLFSGISALFNGLLNARNVFGVTALNAPLQNLGVIAAVLLAGGAWGVEGMAVGVVVGAVAGAVVQLPALLEAGFRFRWQLDWRHPGLQKILALVLPMTIGISVSQTYILIDRILASGLAEGSISALTYASHLVQMPLGLFVTALGTAFFPAFTRQAAAGDLPAVGAGVRRALRAVLLICLPAVAALLVLREPLITLFFERGAFDARAAAMTGFALLFYAPGLVGQASEFILARGFFALHDTRTPVLLGIGAVAVNLLFSLLLRGPLRHGGLALANSLAAMTSMALLVYFLQRRLEGIWDREMWRFSGLVLVAAAVMAGACHLCFRWLQTALPGSGLSSLLLQLSLTALAAGIVYLGTLQLFRLEEVSLLRRLLTRN